MKQSNSASGPNYPLLVWDFGPNEKILLKMLFSRCIASQIEVRPLTNMLSTVSANGAVALANLVNLEPRIFSLSQFPSERQQALAEIQAAMSSISSANLIISECSKLYLEVLRERS